MAGAPSDPQLRRELEAEHDRAVAAGVPGRMHARLAAIDPVTAGQLHPNDRLRILRALEIYTLTGERPSELRRARRQRPAPWCALQLAIDPGRAALQARIDRRCEQMVEGGLLQEVRRLRERGYGPELPSMKAIGYRHMQPVVEGRDTLANVLEAMKRDTRQFARRQRTWLRGQPDVVWMHPDQRQEIRKVVADFLSGGDWPGSGRAATPLPPAERRARELRGRRRAGG